MDLKSNFINSIIIDNGGQKGGTVHILGNLYNTKVNKNWKSKYIIRVFHRFYKIIIMLNIQKQIKQPG